MPFVTSKDGTRIGTSAIGAGPPLVLVDGALCWRASGPAGPLAEALSDTFTVHTYDRRGRGESGGTTPFATAREIEDLEAVIEGAGGTAAVYAISSGVPLALGAANATDRITRLVLYEAPLLTDANARKVDPDYAAMLDALLARGDHAGAVKHFMRKGVGVPAFAVLMMQVMGVTRKLAPVAPTLAYDAAWLMPHWTYSAPTAETWPDVDIPVLCVGGGKSDAWMQEAQLAISRALPNATHKTLAGQNHMVAADAIAPLIREFLA